MNPIEREALNNITKAIRATNQQLQQHGSRIEYVDHEFVVSCNGQISGMGYECGMKPRHSGTCYSFNKDAYFEPDIGGPATARRGS